MAGQPAGDARTPAAWRRAARPAGHAARPRGRRTGSAARALARRLAGSCLPARLGLLTRHVPRAGTFSWAGTFREQAHSADQVPPHDNALSGRSSGDPEPAGGKQRLDANLQIPAGPPARASEREALDGDRAVLPGQVDRASQQSAADLLATAVLANVKHGTSQTESFSAGSGPRNEGIRMARAYRLRGPAAHQPSGSPSR